MCVYIAVINVVYSILFMQLFSVCRSVPGVEHEGVCVCVCVWCLAVNVGINA